MKISPILIALVLCLSCISCKYVYGPRQEVKDFIDAKEAVILDIGKKVEADPTLNGVEAARKIFEERKGKLQDKLNSIRQAPQGINADWLTMLLNSKASDSKYFEMIRMQLIQKMADPITLDQFSALENSFETELK